MEQVLNASLPAAMVYHQSKESARNISAQDLAERFDSLQLMEPESSTLLDGSRPVHHLNFFGTPVYHKCGTSPATSLAVLISDRKGLVDFEKDIRKAILVWDALSFLDPVAYWGPHDTLETLRGTALKEAVTGQCGKLYSNDGTWLEDKFEEHEDAPLNYNDTAKTDVVFDGLFCTYKLAPSSQRLMARLQDSGEDRDVVQRFVRRRKVSRARPSSRLREFTVAADSD